MDDVTERWLPVVGFEGLYDVSDWGRVRSLPRLDIAGRPLAGRIMKQQITNEWGHRRVTLRKDGRSHQLLVHRLVMAAFAGPCPEGQEVRHWNGDPSSNSLSNLLYGTRQENMRDVLRYGTHHNAAKTHCPQGHEYTTENTRIGSHGERNCKTCHREKHFLQWKATQARMVSDSKFRAAENAKSADRARRARARRRHQAEGDGEIGPPDA